jgi:hypothetical protein
LGIAVRLRRRGCQCSGVPQSGIVESAIELGFNDNLSRSPPCCLYDSYYPPSNPNFYNNFSRFSIAANLAFCSKYYRK